MTIIKQMPCFRITEPKRIAVSNAVSAFVVTSRRREFTFVLAGLACWSLGATVGQAQVGGLTIAAGGLTPTIFETEASADPDPVDVPLLLGATPAATPPLPTAAPPGPLLEPGVLATTEEVLVPPSEIQDISAQAADGMFLEEHPVEEMPYEASSGRWFSNGGWYVGGESLWFDRSRNNRVLIARDLSGPGGVSNPTPFTTNSQQYDIAPGARLTLGKSLGRDYVDRDRAVEVVWYGGMAWNNAASISGTFNSTVNAQWLDKATQISTLSTTDFNSWELNYRLRRRLGRDQLIMSPNGNWTRHAERGWLPGLIVGTRIAHVNDFLTIQSTGTGAPPQALGTYRITATNWLVGLNVGGELISQNEFYYWGLRGRTAPCISLAGSTYDVTDTTDPAKTYSGAGSQNFAGVISDLTLMAGWNITPNFALQAGYDFLWVAGIATAPRQLSLEKKQENYIDAGGQMFYNGISFGFNGSW